MIHDWRTGDFQRCDAGEVLQLRLWETGSSLGEESRD